MIFRDMRDPRISEVISITSVDVSADLGYAKVFVSVLGDETAKKNTVATLQAASGFLRKSLSGRVLLRNTPQLRFLLDESIEVGARVLDLIQEVTSDHISNYGT